MINSLPTTGIGIFGFLIASSILLLIWNKPVLVIYMQIGYCCFMRILISDFYFPGFSKYLSDLFTTILVLQIVLQFNKTKTLNIRLPVLIILLFIIVATISSGLNIDNGSPLFFLWGARAYLRFYVLFLACTIFLKHKDIDNLINYLLLLLPVNFFVVLFQYFILKVEDDFVGGLFGTKRGGNSELVVFLFVVMTILFIYYCRKKIRFLKLFVNLLLICVISALSELKTMFLNIPIILGIIFVITFPNKRTVILISTGALLIITTFFLFVVIYPSWLDSFESFNKFVYDSATVEYSGENSLSRTTAGPYILKNILIEPFQKLFGIGFGNAGEFLSFTSKFQLRYEVLAYDYFSYALMLIEIGIIGLSIYCLFFVTVILCSFGIKKGMGDNNFIAYFEITIVVSCLVFFLLVYNPSMYMDVAFIIFFVSSFPYILKREMYESNILLIDSH